SEQDSRSSSVKICLLGPFKISIDGLLIEESRWQRRKAKTLIKLLSLQPRHRLHREQVMDYLFRDLDPESAAKNLNKIIHAARRALEPGLQSGADSRFIVTQDQQVVLGAPGELWIDVEAFEQQAAEAIKFEDPARYEAALALYQGDLLTEDLYEEWA